jgi:hypothetical protein
VRRLVKLLQLCCMLTLEVFYVGMLAVLLLAGECHYTQAGRPHSVFEGVGGWQVQ